MLARLIHRIFITLLLITSALQPLTVLGAASRQTESPDAWQYVAPGIEYRKYHRSSPRPVDIFVARLDRSNQAAIIDSAIGAGKLSGGRERVRDMFARYDQAINFWGQSWGKRNDVAVAINGYYFDLDNATYAPLSGQVHSGWYAKRFSDHICDAGFAWKLSRAAFIGNCITHSSNRNYVRFVDAATNFSIDGVNVPRDKEELILYTPQWDAATNSPAPTVELVVQLTRPALVLPQPSYAVGSIKAIKQASDNDIPFDHIVIAAWGATGDAILQLKSQGLIKKEDEVRITQEITNYGDWPDNDWSKTYASMGGGFHFLKDGVLITSFGNGDWQVPNSRTAVAFNSQYVYFMVVDGWNLGVSEGLTVVEFGEFARDTLGADWGVTLDSGGSSTMVVNGELVNNTTCNFTRDCGMLQQDSAAGIADQTSLPRETTLEPNLPTASEAVEPLVGNALMMVVAEKEEFSTTFTPGDITLVETAANLRLGPGTNYAAVTTLSAGTAIEVLDHSNGLNGVRARSPGAFGSYWWLVSDSKQSGWVREEQLTGGKTPAAPSVFLPSLDRAFIR